MPNFVQVLTYCMTEKWLDDFSDDYNGRKDNIWQS